MPEISQHQIQRHHHVRQVFQEIKKEEEVNLALKSVAQKEHPMLEEKLYVGRLVKKYLDKYREAKRNKMLETLLPLAVNVANNLLLSDELVMNVAFLIEREQQFEFERRVNELDDLFQNEITFRMIGPLPPYSFSTIRIGRIETEQLRKRPACASAGRGVIGRKNSHGISSSRR